MNINLQPLFEAAITVIFAILTRYLVPWIRDKLDDQQQQRLLAAVDVAVYAAEKAYGSGEGQKKLKYAEEYLKSLGYDLDPFELCIMIDAAIKHMEQLEQPAEELVDVPEEAPAAEAAAADEEPTIED